MNTCVFPDKIALIWCLVLLPQRTNYNSCEALVPGQYRECFTEASTTERVVLYRVLFRDMN